MRFDLIDLRLFVHIAEANSLTRGAQRAFLSVPAASMRIKNLEDSLGTRLLYRANQGVTLTAPGQAFLHHARQVIAQIECLNNDMQGYVKGVRGHVRIYANTTAVTEFLPPALSRFLAEHPDVSIDLHERLSADIVRAVTERVTDIGIVAGNVRTDGLQVLPYRRDRLVLAVPAAHPLAAQDTVAFENTLSADYISLHEASAIWGFLSQAAQQLNQPLKVRIKVASFEAVCRLIEAGIGIGVLPESAARRHAATMGIRLLQLEDDWATRHLQICVRDLDALPGFASRLIEQLVQEADD